MSMTAVDYRNETFAGLRGRLEGMRRAVYMAWVTEGAMTTRDLARASGIDLLTLRPRTTELVELGLVRCVGGVKGEGIYEAVPEREWEAWREDQVNRQLVLL